MSCYQELPAIVRLWPLAADGAWHSDLCGQVTGLYLFQKRATLARCNFKSSSNRCCLLPWPTHATQRKNTPSPRITNGITIRPSALAPDGGITKLEIAIAKKKAAPIPPMILRNHSQIVASTRSAREASGERARRVSKYVGIARSKEATDRIVTIGASRPFAKPK